MLSLVLAILGSAAISIVMRLSEGRISARISMLAVNYVTCMVACVLYMGPGSLAVGEGVVGVPLTVGMGVVNGVFYLLGLVTMQASIAHNGVVLSSIASRLGGLLVPMAMAIAIFSEVPGALQVVGALIAIAAVVAINLGKDEASEVTATSGLLIASVFLSDGLASAMSKVFDELGNPELSTHFLFCTFAVAFVLCLVLIVTRKERPGWREVAFGIGIGVPNFFASQFLLDALEAIPAVVAYPTRGVACILLITVAGVALFKEHLRPHQWIALVAILVAVVLLNV